MPIDYQSPGREFCQVRMLKIIIRLLLKVTSSNTIYIIFKYYEVISIENKNQYSFECGKI